MCCAFVLFAGGGWLVHKEWHADLPTLPVQRTLTRLTFDEGLQIGATWSPDGRYIAYRSDRGGKSDIWIQQISGGDPIQVTKGPGQNWQPDWSPNGRYIAYRSEESDGGIYITPALGGVGQQRKIAPFGYYPLWSPDGLEMLFQNQFNAFGYNRFYIAQLDGSPPREVLAEFLKQKKLSAMSAAWYPDGKRITVWVGGSSPSPDFWIVPIAGGPVPSWRLHLRFKKHSQRLPRKANLAISRVTPPFPGHLWAMPSISRGASEAQQTSLS
jgi:dipeptidyl aminopeptidase/acylaminoacyl peptidase